MPEAAYRYLRDQPVWSEDRFSDGVAALRNGNLEVSHRRSYESSYDKLVSRAWLLRTTDGKDRYVESLLDVYACKGERRPAKDVEDTKLMRPGCSTQPSPRWKRA